MQLAKGKETQKSVSNLRYYFISLSILLLLLLLLLKYVSYMFSLSLSISICCEWVFPYNVITTKYSPVINHQHQTLEINVLERGAFISLIHSLVICISHSLLDCCDVGMEWGGGGMYSGQDWLLNPTMVHVPNICYRINASVQHINCTSCRYNHNTKTVMATSTNQRQRWIDEWNRTYRKKKIRKKNSSQK